MGKHQIGFVDEREYKVGTIIDVSEKGGLLLYTVGMSKTGDQISLEEAEFEFLYSLVDAKEWLAQNDYKFLWLRRFFNQKTIQGINGNYYIPINGSIQFIFKTSFDCALFFRDIGWTENHSIDNFLRLILKHTNFAVHFSQTENTQFALSMKLYEDDSIYYETFYPTYGSELFDYIETPLPIRDEIILEKKLGWLKNEYLTS